MTSSVSRDLSLTSAGRPPQLLAVAQRPGTSRRRPCTAPCTFLAYYNKQQYGNFTVIMTNLLFPACRLCSADLAVRWWLRGSPRAMIVIRSGVILAHL